LSHSNPSTYARLVKPPSDGTKSGIDGSVTENGSPFAHTGGTSKADAHVVQSPEPTRQH
jgi:hypothetical protein